MTFVEKEGQKCRRARGLSRVGFGRRLGASIADGVAVFAGFAGAAVDFVHRVPADRRVTAEAAVVGADIVAALDEGALRFVGHAVFHLHRAAVAHCFAGGFGGALVLPVRGVAGFLEVHAEVDLVYEHLDMARRWHAAAHEAEGFPGPAVLQDETGDDGLKRAFAGRVEIGLAGFEGAPLAAVLKREAEAGRNDAAAHAAVVGLDEGDPVARGVGGAEVERVAGAEGRRAGVVGLRGASPDEFAALGGGGFREEAREGDFGERGGGVEFRAVFEGEWLGFDERVQGVGGIVGPRREIEALEDREQLEGGEAPAVGRKLVDGAAALVHGNGIDPRGGVLFETRRAADAAVGVQEGVDFYRDLAAGEGVAAVPADQAECPGERGVLENLAFGGCVAAGDEGVEEGAGELVEPGVADADGPAVGDVVRDGKALLGVA